jgi:hypothetical protein
MTTVKIAVFWDVTPCGSCKSRRFGGTYRLHHQGDRNRHARSISSNIPSSPILVTLLIEAILSSKMTFLTRTTWPNFPEDGILHSHHRGNPKSYILTTVFLSIHVLKNHNYVCLRYCHKANRFIYEYIICICNKVYCDSLIK